MAGPAMAGPSDIFPPGWDGRLTKAERLLGPLVRGQLPGVPVQRRFDSGAQAMLDPLTVPAWVDDGRAFFYWGQDRALHRAEPEAGRNVVVADWAAVSAALAKAGAPAADKTWPTVDVVDGKPVVDFRLGGTVWRVDATAGEATKRPAPKAASNLNLSPDGKAAALVKAHDLYVRGADGVERRITSDGEVWYSFDARYAQSGPVRQMAEKPDAADRVRQVEVIWLPGPGRRFMVERWDFRAAGSTWLINSVSQPRPTLAEQKFPVPGETNLPKPEFWIVDADTGAARKVEAGDWTFMGNMDVGTGSGYWPAPDGKTVLFTRMTRNYGVVELVELTVADGKQRVLVREENAKGFGIRYPQVWFIEDGKALLWKSDRGGRAHYWRVDVATGAARDVTKGDLTVEEVIRVDDAGHRIFFSAFGGAGGDPYYPHTWVADTRSGKTRMLDDAETAHAAGFSPNGRYFIDTASRVDLTPRSVVRRTSDGKVLMPLETANTAALATLGWKAPERVHVPGADGKTEIYGVLWKPTDFDPAKRYPIVVQVYPGPASEGPPVAFAPGFGTTALAEMGFVVLRLGQRGGSQVRDRAYARYSQEHGVVRDYPLADNRAAIIALAKTRPYMDIDRVGIIGESGGGFMTVSAMLAYPDFYKVGVAAAGNYDNMIYEMNSSEYYWGTPGQPGAASYESPAAVAKNLSGALLIVHGDQDLDVSLSHSVRLIDALNRAGKRYEFLLLPGSGHFNFDAATQEYYRRRQWAFLVEHLKADPQP